MNIHDPYWDQSDWKVDDKNWLAERKAEWPKIQNNLKLFSTTTFKGAYLKHHKNLFFKGIIEDEIFEGYGDDAFHFNLPFFVLWYHPNLNDGAIQKILDYACLNASSSFSFVSGRALMKKLGDQCTRKFDPAYGFLGGREKKIIKVLWGEPMKRTIVDQRYPKNFTNCSSLPGVSLQSCSGIFWAAIGQMNFNGDKLYTHYGQHFYEYAMAIRNGLDESDIRWIRVVASAILFPTHKKSWSDLNSKHSIAIRNLMIQRYESGEFPREIQDVWDDVKNGNTDFG